MKKVILATTNKGKIKEFRELLAPLEMEIISIADLNQDKVPEVIEDGSTFEENAILKAKAFYEQFGFPALADDSGLEIDVLDGKPGIYSARYAGEGKDDQANTDQVLRELEGVPQEQRTARFRCAIAYVDGKQTITADGQCTGVITEEPLGDGGFGYDPIFYLSSKRKTMAQLSKEEKNKISHRYQALQGLVAKLMQKDID